MSRAKRFFNYFSKFELGLWIGSILFILIFFFIFDRKEYLTLCSSLTGVTALIFCAKGNPLGQALVLIFSVFYGVISFGFAYYGEMLTYLGMTMPMAIISLVSWVRHPYKNKSEVKVAKVKRFDIILMIVLSIVVTVVFYFALKFFNTSSLEFSTLSVTTSFIAAFLTFKRSPYYAIAYAFNDVVLIILWSIATFSNISYISVVACFVAFLANDIYSFINWRKMQKNQTEE